MLNGAYYTQQCTDFEIQTGDLTTKVLLFNYRELKLACIGGDIHITLAQNRAFSTPPPPLLACC